VEEILDATEFRPRNEGDKERLLDIAKTFSQEAFNMTLSLPSDYFAGEAENFWVAECDHGVYGYVTWWPEDQCLSFALVEPIKTNFRKLVRGFLYKFCRYGPVADQIDAINIRLSAPSEFKLFQDLGFRRSSAGPMGQVCTCELD
jgi:hypothetical protein